MSDSQKKKGAKEEGSMLLRLIASSITIANRSGNIIREVMSGGNLQIVDKVLFGINDLQTEADRRVQKCILASLHHKFPDLTVIGEEEDTFDNSEWIEEGEDDEVYKQEKNFPPQLLSANQNNLCVWVDPLDGTNEYTKGHLDHVTVLIGIAVDGKAVAGIIHQPYYKCDCGAGNVKLGRTIWGVVGLGAFGLTRQSPPTDCRRIVTTRSHETHLVRMAVDACEASEVIKIGGAGFKVLYLIEGKAHAYIFANTGCKKWDTCAPEAVLRSVGGVLTDVRGSDIEYGANEDPPNNGGIVATASKETHLWYIERIPEAVKVGLNV
ncbi:hypothetical protein HELRODRAFT_70686 [Helobdella robusta]|uniref:3'(2'),5'-bisphosphate nucleotidase 1 n=1 Tax=Helobdella robusta TaxID=6412 RepID=T1G0A6_HELRO|nr:hypothetical protein HELRODRAFT_70686 [Helobdella robusta]ESN90632.1 hypothetical protein HELRODRAFT_70686 [Helobdella robusta]